VRITRENTVIGEGRGIEEGILRRMRGGRRKEKGTIRRRWKSGSSEAEPDGDEDAATEVAEAAAAACWSDRWRIGAWDFMVRHWLERDLGFSGLLFGFWIQGKMVNCCRGKTVNFLKNG
jgi:hypothetical protein